MRKALPGYVENVLKELKQSHKHHLEARLVGNTYYISEATTRWNKQRKTVINVKKYLGRIKLGGGFIEGKHRKAMGELENERIKPEEAVVNTEKSDIPILRSLSMNSRITLSNLNKITGIPQSTLYSRIKRMEEFYKIKYTLDIDIEKLGYMRYMAFIKFGGERPNISIIKASLDLPEIQLVLLTKGDYDLIVYILAENNVEASELIYQIRKETPLGRHVSTWYLFPIEETYGFVPIRNAFFKLFEKRIIKKQRWGSRDYKKEIAKSTFAVLTDLNLNSKKEFIDIDKDNGLREGASDYEYYKLRKDGIIKNPTITLTPGARYNIAIIAGINDNVKFRKTQEKLLMDIIEEGTTFIDKYVLVEDINMPDGGLFIAPVMKEGDSEAIVKALKEKICGITINTLIITEIALGSFAYRKFDNTYSRQFSMLVRLFGHKNAERIDYESLIKSTKKEILGMRGEELNIK